MTGAIAALALSRSYLDGLTAETRLIRRGQVLSAVYLRLCRSVHPEVHLQLHARFVADLARQVGKALGGDEQAARAALLDEGALARVDEFAQLGATADEQVWEAAHRVGETLDLLLAVEKGGERKSIGSYFTPRHLAQTVVDRCWAQVASLSCVRMGRLPLVLDPACGGGAFLVEAVRRIAVHWESSQALQLTAAGRKRALHLAAECAHGIDISPFAVATARAALRLLAPGLGEEQVPVERFFVGDALLDESAPEADVTLDRLRMQGHSPLRAHEAFAALGQETGGFDWIVGNPPWVAFQGRATQAISTELRAFYRRRYRAFSGYPTTQ
ncbi:MAG TPA: DNA methyltransferase, partial [Polyangiaceae bacterium]|nr:DNA methyltransferase [Polyangiaceae bacterium]